MLHNLKNLIPRAKTVGLALLALTISAPSFAAGWGDLTGKFVFDGKVPKVISLKITKDKEVCSKETPVDESLVVAKDNSLANVVIYVYLKRKAKIAIHDSYKATAKDQVIVDNLSCIFKPHISLVRTGQELVIKNSDSVGHNARVSLRKNKEFNVIIPAGANTKKTLTKNEPTPMPMGCNIHPWMKGYILIRDNPYMAVSATDGTFEIKNLPAGKVTFVVWHEKKGYLQGVSLGGKKTSKKGRVDLTIKDGEALKLGDIKVKASLLK